MKNLIQISLFLTISTSAMAQLGGLFGKDPANQMTLHWRCPVEDYPGVAKLIDYRDIEVSVKSDGSVKISPNIFKEKLISRQLVKIPGLRGLVNNPNAPLGIDYSGCVDDLKKQLKQAHATNTKNCQTKKSAICDFTEAGLVNEFHDQIKDSPFLNNGTSLPRNLAFNQSPKMEYEQYRNVVAAFCSGESFDKNLVLSAGFQTKLLDFVRFTYTHPNINCVDKLKQEYQAYGQTMEEQYCTQSSRICDYIKDATKQKIGFLESLKGNRLTAIKNQEAEFTLKARPVSEDEYEKGFNDLIEKTASEDCMGFTANVMNEAQNSVKSTLNLPNLVGKNLDRMFSKMDHSCQKTFIRRYIETNSFDRVINDFTYKAHCELNVTDYCKKTRALAPAIEKNIERMLELAYGTYGKDYFRDQILECEKENSSGLDDLLNKLKTFDQKMTCAPMNEGDSKVVGGHNYPTGIEGNYSLKRTSPTETTAYVNIQFSALAGSPTSAADMEARVKSCMKNISPFLKGPDGQSLKIEILNPTEVKQLEPKLRPPVNKVGVGTTGNGRSNSGQYNPHDECPTITHEVMHLFGLCDEYQEKWMGVYYDVNTGQVVNKPADDSLKNGKVKFVNSYNCRNVPKMESVMKSQNDVFERAVPRKVTCQCYGESCKYAKAEPAMQKLFGHSGWGAISWDLRAKFCTSKYKTSLKKAQYLSKPVPFTLLSSSEGAISYNFKALSGDEITNVDMNCNCQTPPASNAKPATEDETKSCMRAVAQLAKEIKSGEVTDTVACPGNTSVAKTEWGGEPSALKKSDGKTIERMVGRSEPVMESILWPSQFNRIVGGGCSEVANLFNQCSQSAYKTALDPKECKVPEECKDDKKLYGIEQ